MKQSRLKPSLALSLPEFDNMSADCNASYQHSDSTVSEEQDVLYSEWSEQAIIVDSAFGEWEVLSKLFNL